MADEKEIKAEMLAALPADVISVCEPEIDTWAQRYSTDGKSCLQKVYSQWKSGKKGWDNKLNSWTGYYLGITTKKPEAPFSFIKRRAFARPSPPDIDSDFEYEKRPLVIDHVVEKYGRGNVGNIGTMGALKLKSALTRIIKALDVANAFDPNDPKGSAQKYTTDNEAKAKEIKDSLPVQNGAVLKVKGKDGKEHTIKTVRQAAEWCKDFGFYMKRYPEILEHAENIDGMLALFGVHASGVVISDIPLDQIAPLRTSPTDKSVLATQFAYEDLETLGLIKFDILGISTLSVIAKAVAMIEQNCGFRIDIENLPLDDKPALNLYRTGQLTGVFQCESPKMQETCKDIGVDRFEDIMAAISLFRPGPMESIPEYCARKRGEKPVSYFHPTIQPHVKKYLEETYGILCIHEDTWIAMADGSEKQIKDVKIFDMVSTVDFANNRTTARECHGCGLTRTSAPGLKITLENGYSVTVTPDHKVRVFGEWVEAGSLDPDKHFIAVPERIRDQRGKPLGEQWLGDDCSVAYFIGLITGDAQISSGVTLCCGSEDNAAAFEDWLSSHLNGLRIHKFFHCRSWYLGLSHPDLLNDPLRGNRKTRFHDFLERFDLKKTCYYKTVPFQIQQSTNDVKAAYIAGLLDSDGRCGLHDNRFTANITSTSTELCRGVRRIMQSLGITNHLRKNKIHIYDVPKLHERVSKFLVIKSTVPYGTGGKCGVVPIDAVNQHWKATGLSRRAWANKYNMESIRTKHCNFVTTGVAKRVCDIGDLRYYRIAKIEPVTGNFYSMSVAEHHNLIANGVVIKNCYQEQIMQICHSLGGLTVGEGYVVIKGISKKKHDVVNKFKPQFIEGCVAKGVPQQVANEYWDKFITPFALYGFNKAHSTCYAYNSYITAYLKANFPEEFMVASMNVCVIDRYFERDEKNKAKKKGPPGCYEFEEECINMGMTILPRDINKCDTEYKIVRKKDPSTGHMKSEIRPALACKGLSSRASENIVATRLKYGPFNSMKEFAERTDTSAVDSDAVEALCDAKFFRSKKEELLKQFRTVREDMKELKKKGRESRDLFDED